MREGLALPWVSVQGRKPGGRQAVRAAAGGRRQGIQRLRRLSRPASLGRRPEQAMPAASGASRGRGRVGATTRHGGANEGAPAHSPAPRTWAPSVVATSSRAAQSSARRHMAPGRVGCVGGRGAALACLLRVLLLSKGWNSGGEKCASMHREEGPPGQRGLLEPASADAARRLPQKLQTHKADAEAFSSPPPLEWTRHFYIRAGPKERR